MRDLRLLLLLATTDTTNASAHRDRKNHILSVAHDSLARAASSASPRTRSVVAAPHDSTFTRFLVGHKRPYRNPTPTTDGEIRVIDYGADPTGAMPSDTAFDKAIAVLLSHGSKGEPRMASNITDLGGAVIQLSGGTYLLERPLVFPPYIGNFRVVYGTLRASPSAFPRKGDHYLIEMGGSVEECKKADPKQKSCNENVGFEDLTIDGGRVAYGGLSINATSMRPRLDPLSLDAKPTR